MRPQGRPKMGYWLFLPPLPTRHGLVFQLAAQLRVVRHHRAHRVPKARAVVHHPQVTEFVNHHIVQHRLREMNQPPVQPNRTIISACKAWNVVHWTPG